MPRRRSSRQQLLAVKRIEKEKETRRQSIEELILAEERRLQEKKARKRRDDATRKVLEHATSLEFELQQLIIKLQRTPRQKELMRQAKLERENVYLLGNGNKKSTGDVGAFVVPESENAEPPTTLISTKLWRFSAAFVLSHLLVEDTNGWFHRPVSHVVSNYAAAISPSQPSDLGTVWCRLMQNRYDSCPDRFVDDVRRIWRNCVSFNGEAVPVSVEAMRLSSVFEGCWMWLMSKGTKGSDQDQATGSSIAALAPSSIPEAAYSDATASMKHTVQGERNENDIGDDDNDEEWLPSDAGAPQSKSIAPTSSSPTSVKPLEAEAEAPDPPSEKLYSIVQCDHCGKWHNVPSTVNVESLPDLWFCSMNTWEPREAQCDLRRKMGVITAENADEPFVLFEKAEWLAYAREIAKFVSACKKLTLPKQFIEGLEILYLEVQNEARLHADADI